MKNQKCMIIAEAGVNHNGRLDLALELCDAAKAAGADVVKFQTWKTESLLTRTVGQAAYQARNTGRVESQFDMLKRLELSYDDFRAVKQHCDEIGILFASTADEPESLDFVVSLGVPFLKVGSAEIGNIPYLRCIGGKGLPVLLSTGMSSISDVVRSVDALREGGAADITLLHCVTDYPCALEDVNLRAMLTLKEAFQLPVGYSDHTVGCEAALAAVALGAGVVEKHFTLDCQMEGPDHSASIEPSDLAELVHSIRAVERCLGTGKKEPTASERRIAEVVKKRIVAKKAISAGERFTEENLCVKRNDAGAFASQWDLILGKTAMCAYQTDDPVY